MPRARKQSAQFPLQGKVALVTGASQGIGLAIARALAHQRCHLVLTGRTLAPLEKAGRELTRTGIRVLAMACDVRDPRSVQSLAASVRKQFGRVDLLINNAGISHSTLPIPKLTFELWREVIDTNLNGTFLVTREILPLMRKGSAVVNNLSIAAVRVFPGMSAYSASKHGALALTNTLREEQRANGIRVIARLPGATDTRIWETFWPEAPRAKMMKPETVAQALINVLALPENATVEELMMQPTAGPL